MTGNLFPARLNVTHIEKHQNTNYRRNGKLQACEPCRKGKLRCDHHLPVCDRCVKRGRTNKCVYHSAPLTKSAAKSGTERASRSVAYIAHLEHANRPTGFSNLSRPAQAERSSTASTPDSTARSLSSISQPRCIGSSFQQALGSLCRSSTDHCVSVDDQESRRGASFINHTAVLDEHEQSIGLTPPVLTAFQVSQERLDQGTSVLRVLKDLKSIRKYINKWFSFAGGVVVLEPMVNIYLDGLSASWKHILEPARHDDLRAMSAEVWNNTSRPLTQSVPRGTTAREYCTNVTGAGVRWEVIGLILSLVSLVTQSLKDGDPVFCSPDAAPVDRAALALSTHHASQLCIEFCDDIGVLNDIYLWHSYENFVAYCSLRSRGSCDSWRKASSFVAALQCANLHQGIEVDDSTPFFLAELRKRLFICAYSNDKSTAAFVGRPPKLTRLYCRLQLPLDLTDAQIMSDEPELMSAIERLDREGWNQDDTVQRGTFARIAATNALITEEILEISLGCFSGEEIARRAVDIEARALSAWQNLPEFLRIDVNDPWSSRRSPLELLFLIHIRLTSLDHHFLLQRTLSKKVQIGSVSPLLSVCSEIFKIVVIMVDNKDYFRDFQIDFVQILCTHGIPAASILAMELLRQDQPSTSASVEVFPLHRSDTIQSLSVFAACLGTIRPDANGYQSCERARKFVKRVLDVILGPGPAPQGNSGQDAADPTLSTPLFEQGSDEDFMHWLDGVHWDQESWINLT